ncbi:MAG: hypothetical protein ACI9XR_000910 [Flavobacterium sp.]|jgi:hypothetical protein
MDTSKILELLFYTLPAVITGLVAFYFFENFVKNENNRRNFILRQENQKQALPIRLQAFERLTLFLERINPAKLLVRVAPLSEDKLDYSNLLVQHIEQEFEHNLTQQIYLSNEAWTIILSAKNTTIQIIRQSTLNKEITSSHKLREAILTELGNNQAPSTFAIDFLKNELLRIL